MIIHICSKFGPPDPECRHCGNTLRVAAGDYGPFYVNSSNDLRIGIDTGGWQRELKEIRAEELKRFSEELRDMQKKALQQQFEMNPTTLMYKPRAMGKNLMRELWNVRNATSF